MQGSHKNPEHLEDVLPPPEVQAGAAGCHPGAVCLEEGTCAAELPEAPCQHRAHPEELPSTPGMGHPQALHTLGWPVLAGKWGDVCQSL